MWRNKDVQRHKLEKLLFHLQFFYFQKEQGG